MIHSHPTHARRWLPDVSTALIMLAISAILAMAAIVVIPRIGQLADDLDYGYPRTMHLAAHVGHDEQSGQPTRFVAMNLNRQPLILEFPGGDVNKARILKLPYLFGAEEDLTPVRITLALINGDKEPDLVVSIKNEEVIYINEGGAFRLINDAERAQVEGK